MRIILTFSFIFSSVLVVLSQERFDIKWRNDTVYNNNKALFTCKEKVQANKRMYTMRNFDNKQLVILYFEDHDTVSKGSATFPSIGMSYRIYCQKEKANAWLDIYIRNGIISNGEVDSMALKAYCQSRLIPLKSMPGNRKAMRPTDKDSVAKSSAMEESAGMIALSVFNKADQPVTVNIGNPAESKSQVILPGTGADLKVKEGDNICVLDKNNKASSCRSINQGVTKITINKTGSAFE